MHFSSLSLSDPILKALAEKGYTEPSPIQEQAIPAVLSGQDVMAAAQTGTGKTAGFTLPMLEILAKGKRPNGNQARALVLTPTRELAAQVGENVAAYSQYLTLKSTIVFGGVKINPQMQRMRGGVDILIATPGRLIDLYNQNAVKFDQLEMLVLDEADRMLDMGFIHDIKRIISFLPKQRQNLLFSATFSQDIRALAKGLVTNPVEISVTPPNTTVERIKQWMISVDKTQKTALLMKLIKQNDWQQVLVFSRTKSGANRLEKKLNGNGISATAIHGDKRQNARTKALSDFKEGKVKVMVATDIAARGIDIALLPHVVNFDLPNVPEDYVHRIGRTARAGQNGEAVSFVDYDEFDQLIDIEHLIGELLPREVFDGFEPNIVLPESKLGMRKPKKPKKPKSDRSGRENAKGRPGNSSRSGNKPNGRASTKNNSSSDSPYKGKRSRSNGSNRRKPS